MFVFHFTSSIQMHSSSTTESSNRCMKYSFSSCQNLIGKCNIHHNGVLFNKIFFLSIQRSSASKRIPSKWKYMSLYVFFFHMVYSPHWKKHIEIKSHENNFSLGIRLFALFRRCVLNGKPFKEFRLMELSERKKMKMDFSRCHFGCNVK